MSGEGEGILGVSLGVLGGVGGWLFEVVVMGEVAPRRAAESMAGAKLEAVWAFGTGGGDFFEDGSEGLLLFSWSLAGKKNYKFGSKVKIKLLTFELFFKNGDKTKGNKSNIK